MTTITDHAPQTMNLRQFLALVLGSLGVVYGDIGTSPLYAFREAIRPFEAHGVDRGEIIGLISLVIWTLIIIVTLKYVILLLRADNNGEGGTLALLALLIKKGTKYPVLMFFTGIFGASLFIGDAMITPALSVLSAVEGLKLVTPELYNYVLPISIAIMVVLFAVQSRGTGAVSIFFGPIMLIWFVILGAAGVAHIGDDLAILDAFNPVRAVIFLWDAGLVGFIVLGAVFLTVTGAEALYADLGHFGRAPIQAAWLAIAFPALTLNYLGQGALVLSHPESISNPFFLMFPEWALLPVVILATLATIIASQSVITGAFSLVRQALHLGFLPRLKICYTSETHTGQIYLPLVNMSLLIGVLVLMFVFGSSEALAPAYGVSITGAMLIDTILAFEFVRRQWGWATLTAAAVLLPLFWLEMVFLGANLFKIHHGGYVPILFAGALITLMWTWRRGVALLREKTARLEVPLDRFIAAVERKSEHAPVEVPGTAIFLTAAPDTTPSVLLHNIKHNHVLHEHNVILTIKTASVPYVAESDRYTLTKLSERFCTLELRFGFMDDQNVSRALARCRKEGFKFEIMSTSFYLGRRKLVPDPASGMPKWQDRLFIAMAGSAIDPTEYFHLPPNRVVEVGEQTII